MDLVLALDGSSSSNLNFDSLKKAVRKMLNRYSISEDDTHVAIMEYSDGVTLVTKLNRNNSLSEIQEILKGLQPSRGYNRLTSKALQSAADTVFTPGYGGRPGASKVLVIFTRSGPLADKDKDPATTLKNDGVGIIIVGPEPEDTKGVPTSPGHVVPIMEPTKITDVVDDIVDKITKDHKKS